MRGMRSMKQIRARWSAVAGSVGVALLLAATQGTAAAGAATTTPVRGVSRGNRAGWSGNLIADGNAAAGCRRRDWNAATTIPGWSIRTGSPNVMCYAAARVRHPAGPAGPDSSAPARTATRP